MKKGTANKAVLRKDYKPYPWILEQVTLSFDVAASETRVRSRLDLAPRDRQGGPADVVLDGRDIELNALHLNGRKLEPAEYEVSADRLIVHAVSGRCTLEIDVTNRPEKNTALEGLYCSGDFLLTQCEAEGFRKISYFPDRPDVMTRFDVTLTADARQYPILLSNGNAVGSGKLNDGRHWVRWSDPFAKPSYLFALVAGDLACVEDQFRTQSGREVTLRVFVERPNADRCEHAMQSLRRAMRWDEKRFGLEYDLDVYNIVVTDDFNMGAMENKSLNIFNSTYVLARPDTATDLDYQNIEGVIAHEYFHNWTGNRVTCRDWFQLTLKEGLTVFRDQEFSSDIHSRAVKRIRDVRILRSRQFPEDAGPMAHPIRPDKYQEINNFYTMTVYQKGAEVIRMIHTLLGERGFRRGMDLYFERHDGAAVTCDDFLAAMADANGADLSDFGRWYGQSGTPVVTARGEFDPSGRRYALTLSQQTPATQDQAKKQPLVIPVAMGLLAADGSALPLQLTGEPAASGTSRLLLLDCAERTFVFANVTARPIPSLLRGFSAPVRLDYPYSSEDLAMLLARDEDPFVRWEAAQQLALREILANVDRLAAGRPARLAPATVDAFRALLDDRQAAPGLLAEMLLLPYEQYVGEQMPVIDVDGVHAARKFVKRELARLLHDGFTARYHSFQNEPYSKEPQAMARRSLRNACLSYLVESDGGHELALQQLQASDNMTDTLAALQGLAWTRAPQAEQVLDQFEQQWRDDTLVINKWFAIQAATPGADTVDRVRSLLRHPLFSLSNPNKVRSLIGVFSLTNPTGFHAADGSGYRLLSEQVIRLDALNPQVAARMVAAFNPWTRYDAGRRALMRSELQRIAKTEGLSPDVGEIVGNALEMKRPGGDP